MRRALTFLAGTTLAAAGSVLLIGPAQAAPTPPPGVPGIAYNYIDPEDLIPPPQCPPGNAYIIMNNICIRVS